MLQLVTTLRLRPDALCFLLLLAGQPAWAASPLASCQRLGAWVTEVDVDDGMLQAVQVAVPAPSSGKASPCVRLEAAPTLPRATTEALLHALRAVCPADVVTVVDV